MKGKAQDAAEPVTILRKHLAKASTEEQEAWADYNTAKKAADRLRQAIDVLEGKTSPERQMPDDSGLPATGLLLPRLQPNDTMLSGAEAILRAIGRPVHVRKLVALMIEAGFKNQNAKLLQGSITRTLDRGVDNGPFTKPRAATYGLKAWGSLMAGA